MLAPPSDDNYGTTKSSVEVPETTSAFASDDIAALIAAASTGTAADLSSTALYSTKFNSPNALLSLSAPSIFPRDFWLVKTKKTGGSTLKGILNGLCAHHAMTCMTMPVDEDGQVYGFWEATRGTTQIARYRQLGFKHLAITDHGKYDSVLAAQLRNPLLFTSVRDPVSRVISHFFFVYREGGAKGAPDLLTMTNKALSNNQPIPQEVLDKMKEYVIQEENLMFKDIADKPKEATPFDALQPYDFIFVQERFDEAVVAFALEYGLTFRDIAYTSAKNQTGRYPTKDSIPAEMIEFIEETNALDQEVYRLAEASLDSRITAIREAHSIDPESKPDFDAVLEKFRRLQAHVVEECSDHMRWYKDQGFHDGYFYNNDGGAVGEGFRCVDYVARRFEAGLLH
ncbi:hypothetical protein Ndes2437B_g08044 [Nannochloris sp. 'desiccata']